MQIPLLLLLLIRQLVQLLFVYLDIVAIFTSAYVTVPSSVTSFSVVPSWSHFFWPRASFFCIGNVENQFWIGEKNSTSTGTGLMEMGLLCHYLVDICYQLSSTSSNSNADTLHSFLQCEMIRQAKCGLQDTIDGSSGCPRIYCSENKDGQKP